MTDRQLPQNNGQTGGLVHRADEDQIIRPVVVVPEPGRIRRSAGSGGFGGRGVESVLVNREKFHAVTLNARIQIILSNRPGFRSSRVHADKRVGLLKPAFTPTNVLALPVVLLKPVALPKNELPMPVVFAAPAFLPANKLSVPATLNTRLPPILYCVCELTVLPLRIPSAVPLPEILKLAACAAAS